MLQVPEMGVPVSETGAVLGRRATSPTPPVAVGAAPQDSARSIIAPWGAGQGRPPTAPEDRRVSAGALPRVAVLGDVTPASRPGTSTATTAAPTPAIAATPPPPEGRGVYGEEPARAPVVPPLQVPCAPAAMEVGEPCSSRGGSSLCASLRTTMGHFGLPEPPQHSCLMRTTGSDGPLQEEDEEQGDFITTRQELSQLPWQHQPADLIAGGKLASTQDSLPDECNPATSFVMRSSPFQASTPSRTSDAASHPRVSDRLSERASERLQDHCGMDLRSIEAERVLAAQQWLPPCDIVPEESLESPLRHVEPQQEPQRAVSRHRGSPHVIPPSTASPPFEEEGLIHSSAGGTCDNLDVALDDKPVAHGSDGGAFGSAADDTDADIIDPMLPMLHDPVQPLRPRMRGLPGNTAQNASGDSGSLAANAIEKKLVQSVEKPQPQFCVDGVGAPPPQPASPHESMARPQAMLLSDTGLTVQRAAVAVNVRDLAELRSFRHPPAMVCQVLEAVAVILGVEETKWAQMRKLLDKEFVARIKSFDPAGIPPAQAERLAVLLQVPTFSDGLLGERCPAVLSLAAWCNAVGRHLEGPLPAGAPLRRLPLPVSGGNRLSRREGLQGQLSSGALLEADNGSAGSLARPDLNGLEVEPDLWSLTEEELAQVPELRISRAGVGSVTFHGMTDCRGLARRRNLLDVIVLNPGEVVVYPNQHTKPPAGVGLNKPASVCLFGCLPKGQGLNDRRARERYKKRVRQMTEDKGAEFVDYDCDEGIWQFRVAHF